jgi:hypothetical protein
MAKAVAAPGGMGAARFGTQYGKLAEFGMARLRNQA